MTQIVVKANQSIFPPHIFFVIVIINVSSYGILRVEKKKWKRERRGTSANVDPVKGEERNGANDAQKYL